MTEKPLNLFKRRPRPKPEKRRKVKQAAPARYQQCQVCHRPLKKGNATYPVDLPNGQTVVLKICKYCNRLWTFNKYGAVVTWEQFRADQQAWALDFQLES